MTTAWTRTLCWTPIGEAGRVGVGCEHLQLSEGMADGVVLAIDDERGPFRLWYRLAWDVPWRLHTADLTVMRDGFSRALRLRTDARRRWRYDGGDRVDGLDGCVDLDLWPTPFTNSFPINRHPLYVGERREYRVAWIFGPDLTIRAQSQAYTRLAEHRYRFESLDGNGFQAELVVDDDGIVRDYPGLFQRQE